MFKYLAAYAAISALAGSSPTFAATSADVTYQNDGLEVSVHHGNATHHPAPQPPKGQTTIFSNINTYYPDAVYYPFEGAAISGPNTLHGVSSVAVQFTPSADASVSQISAAIGTIAGTADFDLSIYSDSSGAPGTALGGGEVKNLKTTLGDCCDLASVKVSGVSLKAGTPYWMVVAADAHAADAQGGWSFNTIDETDIVTIASNRGSGWNVSNDYNAVPAFAVYGK